MQSDRKETPSDSGRCISADVFACVSQKVRIAQMLEIGFQLKVCLLYTSDAADD